MSSKTTVPIQICLDRETTDELDGLSRRMESRWPSAASASRVTRSGTIRACIKRILQNPELLLEWENK